jgi:photosystem II stability/assembly factor-like uncharacterized protein
VRALVIISGILFACACALASGAVGATSSSTVGATVLGATTLDTSLCSGTDLQLGTMAVTSTSITPTPCSVVFGSSNDTASLLTYQSDGVGTAFGSSGSFAQKNASPTITNVGMASATDSWIVGYGLVPSFSIFVEHSTDSGVTWVPQTACGATNYIWDVDAVSTTTAVLVGSSNKICRTTDGGTTWSAPTTLPAGALNWAAVDLLPSGDGWAAGTGGYLAHTTDSGATWTRQQLPTPYDTLTLSGITTFDANHIYAVGTKPNGGLQDFYAVVSSDGGATWSEYAVGPAQAVTNAGIAAVSTSTLLVTNRAGTYKSTDSGVTWTLVDGVQAQRVVVQSATTWETIWSGTPATRRTTDGGATWNWVLTGSTQPFGIDSFGASTTMVAGFNHSVAISTDAGVSFTSQPSPYANLNGVAAWSSNKFVSVGDRGRILRTSDGGTSFTYPASGTTNQLVDVVSIPGGVAVAVGKSGTILRSTDYGGTWTTISAPTAVGLDAIERTPEGVLLVSGDTGTILRSVDDGVTWTTRPSPGAVDLLDITSVAGGTYWVGGAGGLVARSTDFGATWTTQAAGTTNAVTTVDAASASTVGIITTNASSTGIVRTSNDGGTTWATRLTASASTAWTALVFVDDATAYVGGWNLQFQKSTDAGLTWSSVAPAVSSHVLGIAALAPNAVALVGSSEAIATTVPTLTFADYAFGSTDFSGASSTFGACLETAPNTASTNWPVAGTGNCTSAALGSWRAIGVDRVAPTALLATSATGVTTARADLYFGAKAATAQAAGKYAAGITFEVVAA